MKFVGESKEFLQKALITWGSAGYDKKHGGYVEALSFSGKPQYNLDKRFRIHPRNIFSHSAGTVWGYSDTLSVAKAGALFMMEKCWMPRGGFVSLTTRDGSHKDKHIRTYEHAFVLLGFGWLYYATKDDIYKKWLYKVWGLFETIFAHSDGGFVTSIPDDGSPRQQNPHMHIFEALLNLYELFGDKHWIIAAEKIYGLFRKHMCTYEENIIREFFKDNWMPDEQKGELVDPGHHYEWIWLLCKYERLTGKTVDVISNLYTFALLGTSPVTGLGYDECYFDGRIYRDTHRLWVQTEKLKAHLALRERATDLSRKEKHLDLAEETLKKIFSYYFITDKGVWYDQVDEHYNNISKNAPASTLYHVLIALHEYICFCSK